LKPPSKWRQTDLFYCVSRWSTVSKSAFDIVGLLSIFNFASLIEAALGQNIAGAIKVLVYSTRFICACGEVPPTSLKQTVDIANFSGNLVLTQLQGLITTKSLEKLSQESRCAVFLVVFATTISTQYYQAWTVSLYTHVRTGEPKRNRMGNKKTNHNSSNMKS
jgi:hypothetical protein